MDAPEDTLRAALILLLDNKDSFVWNLAQALRALGREVTVRRSDRVDLAALDARDAPLPAAIVLSPGPGRPEHAGVSVELVQQLSGRVPILGVCLGHQAIATAFGAAVIRGDPCHGRPWPIRHDGAGLYRGLPQDAMFCRYHSLCVDAATLPPDLIANAYSREGVVMGLRHRVHPTFGVQFHPESFCSPHGAALLANFLEAAA